MEISIDITETARRVRKRAEVELINSTNRVASSVVDAVLASGRYGGKEGLGHERIRKKIEDFVLSDAFDQKVDEIIDRVVDEELEKAVRAVLNSKARKALFRPTSPVLDERIIGS